MACTPVRLWISIFFLLYRLSLTFLFLSFMSPHLCFASQNRYPNPSLCTYFLSVFRILQNINAHTYLFPRSQSSLSRISYFPCKSFASPSWPSGIYYKLQLHVLPFVIHHTRQTYWNIAVVLPAAWMRLTGTFLGLQ